MHYKLENTMDKDARAAKRAIISIHGKYFTFTGASPFRVPEFQKRVEITYTCIIIIIMATS